jgi:N-acetylmuramoyl-L-alanine amidase
MRIAHSRLLLRGAVLIALFSTPSLAAPLSAPRVAAYPGYTRLALDVPPGTSYTLEPLGAALRVTFAGATTTSATVRVGKPELSGYTLENRGNAAVLTLAAPQGVSKRSGFRASKLEAAAGKTGYRLVLDFSGAFADISKLTNPPTLRLASLPPQPFTVLLDPGHGGTDPGAVGSGVQESAFNLGMSLRVKALLERMQGVRVQLTRSDNRVFSRDKRTDLNARAQLSRGKTLFVSLHANAIAASKRNSQYGTEVYYFGPRGQKPLFVAPAAPLEVVPTLPNNAASTAPTTTSPSSDASSTVTPVVNVPAAPPIETTPAFSSDPVPEIATTDASTATVTNDSSELGETGDKLPNEFAPASFTAQSPDAQDDPLSGIQPETTPEALVNPTSSAATTPEPIGVLPPSSFGLSREAASKDLASNVLSRMLWAMGSFNRGVRTADFYVIKYSEVPAILVETGFISHPVESQQLKNPNYQERIAYGIASGIAAYLNGLLKPQ